MNISGASHVLICKKQILNEASHVLIFKGALRQPTSGRDEK